tara:strand:+ start:458 stop:577 length:120 start_codon:yes stop_codon:yes gene_type:complete
MMEDIETQKPWAAGLKGFPGVIKELKKISELLEEILLKL